MKKEFYNIKYGKCNLLDKDNNWYLVYAEKCDLHYIVCSYIDDMGTMMVLICLVSFMRFHIIACILAVICLIICIRNKPINV